MPNLCYFCHFHRGDKKEKTIKIGGSLLVAIALFIFGFSIQISSASEQEADFLAALVPEPGYLIMAATDAETTMPAPMSVSEPTAQSGGTETKCPSGEEYGKNDQGQMTCVRREEGMEMKGEMDNEKQDAQREEFEKAQMERERNEILKRQLPQQRRELNKVVKQLKRLKGADDDVASAQIIAESLNTHESAIKNAREVEDMRDAISAYREDEMWEKINDVRRKVELPRELNSLYKELKKIEKILATKSYQKLGYNLEAVKARLQELFAMHSSAKAAYAEGNFEDAEATLQEFHNNFPGNLLGALGRLRDMRNQLRGIKDKDFKADIEDLLQDPLADINSGEWQDARESLDAIWRELGPVVWQKIMRSEKNRSGVPEEMFEKIQKLKEKLGEEGEEPQTQMPQSTPQ
ncbi:hypothetical protein A3B21_02785 [Candidatus Uhrbacteria bacterium RIFCSPLOWO2_01_FULL_47_24]|uniref:Uncharacterized protein n=1 Tax=Candidatus Uhrbacteria bacterium RIFCSPLOWO2_01_FULL_47_24 TaxID=1802401 RepID=A0A1F7USB4_9BACT|nr:MAG: hypothetical protein A2753_03800 [Candidatus Uhrbacteria bacterium RIFCSPHIGHO2_01_FULL_47_11]OGL68622.1 MAG: hypothetical protein A3D58_01810 [Candidatus Uhrbacteria bacterium RIFCSPHIGHO2_02_FULL_46_47]OGL74706.1 MAG: hypothetical protein A3F52_00075 [Candidatus Uhrbacteria bacterium RIFCSPHIGHO2_12_FULL_47_11]OGL81190.1 MAG: hypothetical protein A3B21_02785 [Candidatus Uhrbacteria bacterium RIFCSPLOWO2_01_FULL_47_24]OGL84645.1 MAG: hypothetical protein A3J03_02470 [Candidatus Uhrbact